MAAGRGVIGKKRAQGKPLSCAANPSNALSILRKARRSCGKWPLTNPKRWLVARQDGPRVAGLWTRARAGKRASPSGPAPFISVIYAELGVQDGHDLEGRGVDHHDLVADQDEVVTAPFRIDRHDIRRKRVEADVSRHAGADRNVEVDASHGRDVLVPDHRGDLGALLGRELGTTAGLTRRHLRTLAAGLGFRVHSRIVAALAAFSIHLAVVAALAAFSIHLAVVATLAAFRIRLGVVAAFSLHLVVAALAALGLHVAALTLTRLGLHVLAALGLILRAHALGLLTGSGLLSALALGGAGRTLFGLRRLLVGRATRLARGRSRGGA